MAGTIVLTTAGAWSIPDPLSLDIDVAGALTLTGQTVTVDDGAAQFTDDFSSGDLSKVENGIQWDASSWTQVISGFGYSGDHCLRFNFQAGTESWAEQRFDLGADYSEVIIQFRIYYPTGSDGRGVKFVHRASGGYGTNNKFFRLWKGNPADGNDGYAQKYVKYGASTGPQSGGDETIYVEWGGNYGGTGQGGSSGLGTGDSAGDYLTDDYRGRWIPIKIRCKVATEPNDGYLGNGIVEVWRDGEQILSATQLDSWVTVSGGVNGLRYGYLLGYANSGFADQTYAYIDDVSFTVTE